MHFVLSQSLLLKLCHLLTTRYLPKFVKPPCVGKKLCWKQIGCIWSLIIL